MTQAQASGLTTGDVEHNGMAMRKLKASIICGFIGGIALPVLVALVSMLGDYYDMAPEFTGRLFICGIPPAFIAGLVGGAFVGYLLGKP